MATLKERKGQVVTIMTVVIVLFITVLMFVARFAWGFQGYLLTLFGALLAGFSVLLALMMNRCFQPYLHHDNREFSPLVYQVKLLEEEKKTLSTEEANQLKTKFLDFVKKHPEMEAEVHRYMGDAAFALRDTDEALQQYAMAMDLLPHDSEDFIYMLNRRAACMLRKGDFEQAIDEFRYVSQVNPIYSVGLAMMYEFGWGVERDVDKACQLCEQSYKAGNDAAVVSYYEIQWRQTHPVPQPDGHAQYMLKWFSQEGFMAGLEDLKRSAEAGYAPSQYELGVLYMQGKLGKNKGQEAFEWFKKSADQKYLPSMHNLGFIIQIKCMDPVLGDVNKPVIPHTMLYKNKTRIASFYAGYQLILEAANAGYGPSKYTIEHTKKPQGL